MIKFTCPFTMIVSGCTCSGKTTFVKKILKNIDLFEFPPRKIYYCYGVYSPAFETMKNVELIQGLPNDFSKLAEPNEHRLVILDDLQQEAASSKAVETLFTRDAHHKNLSVCLLNQNLFYQGKFCRTIALNAHVLVLFRNPRSNSQIRILESQIGLKHLREAYTDAMNTPYGYLIIDLSPTADPTYKMRTHIFPGEDVIIYE